MSAHISLNETGTRWLARLDQYIATHGHPNVPVKYRTPDGFRLGNWLAQVRYAHRNGNLSEDMSEALADRQVKFTGSRLTWDGWMRELRAYVKRHGDAAVPVSYVTKDGRRLGKWLANVRQHYSEDNPRITTSRVTELVAAGVDLNSR